MVCEISFFSQKVPKTETLQAIGPAPDFRQLEDIGQVVKQPGNLTPMEHGCY